MLLLALMPLPAFACKCLTAYPVCREVASSDLVFAGTVESVEPAFLDPWHWRDPVSRIPVDEIQKLRDDNSPAAAQRLKVIYLQMLGELSDSEKHELEVAVTHKQVEAAFNSITAQGRRAKLKVLTIYREAKDDDDEKKDPDGEDKKRLAPREITVWTGQGDCGIDFQPGETYLVYAGNDEETGRLETSICYRTRRLTDAGPDLAYLHFLKEGGDASSRLEGFVSTDRRQDNPKTRNAVDSPAPNLVVALIYGGKSRYTRSSPDGRFIFDGLVQGDYDLSVYESEYPRTGKLLTGPEKIAVPAKGCADAFVIVPHP
jgi:hypothetical protein